MPDEAEICPPGTMRQLADLVARVRELQARNIRLEAQVNDLVSAIVKLLAQG